MIEVRETGDPTEVLREAGAFLLSRPVEHNVILSILHMRLAHPEAGRYWWITDDGAVAGVGMQTPMSFSATTTPMPPELVRALVAVTDPPLPGFIGEAATAAAYAGAWAQRHRVPVAPTEGERLFRLDGARWVGRASGSMRPAERGERALLIAWLDGFNADTGGAPEPSGIVVDRYLHEHSAWLWVDDEPVAMARAAPVVGGVARIGPVYTPPERRGCGYATTCVESLSRRIEESDHVAILYTRLTNPTSNAIYQRIGYEPVLEVLRYRFDHHPISG
ncbi:MAG: GNAT family N-acetyltransferase [Acidimicrobiia bacterium]